MQYRFMIGLVLSTFLAASHGYSVAARIPDKSKMTAKFPEGFLLGSSIAGFQAEMGCPTLAPEICEDRNSDWYQFVTQPDFIKNPLLYISGDNLNKGPGFRELFSEDLGRVSQDLGQKTLRLSIEWSRIFPGPTYGISGYTNLKIIASKEGVAYYHKLFQDMRRQGIKPLVTLNHYTLPLWIHNGLECKKNLSKCSRRGWADPKVIVPEIAKYAGFVAEEFGAEVDDWATLNEPLSAVVLPGYIAPSLTRSNPPGLYFQIGTAKIAAGAMIEAHARMYDAVHAADRWDADGDGVNASVGLVSAFSPVLPHSDSKEDKESSVDASYIVNHLFLQALVDGKYDANWDGTIVDRPDLKGRMDFIGINYYLSLTVQKAWIPVLGMVSKYLTLDPLHVGVEGDRPEGIYDVIAELSRYKIPMIITETGVDATQKDEQVESWLVKTLAWTRQAVADGYDVRGYYYWTLFDNYEWNRGTAVKMGLYKVDPDDPAKARTPRSVVPVYKAITDAAAISADSWDRVFTKTR